MARRCTIPCNIDGVERRIRRRVLQQTAPAQLPLAAIAVVLAVASVALLAVAPWPVALIAALFFLLGAGVIVGRTLLGTSDFAHLGVPAELDRIIDEHEGEIHEARLPRLRAEAAGLTYDSADYRARVTYFLQDLRGATGEAWRCPCRKRRLPIPMPI